MRDLAVRTDTELARLDGERQSVWMLLGGALDTRKSYEKHGYYTAKSKADLDARIADLVAKKGEIERAMAPLDAIYEEHKWTRAFLVVLSGKGHVHRSMRCATCRPTTAFAWLPEYSGGSEFAIVEDAGERACTVCYPSAPVSILSRPSRIFSKDERIAQAAREERAAAKIARDAAKAAKAPTKDGRPLTILEVSVGYDGKVHTYKRDLNTEVTAVSEYHHFTDRLTYLKDPTEIEATKVAMTAILIALAEKHGVSTIAMGETLAAKYAKKMKKENG